MRLEAVPTERKFQQSAAVLQLPCLELAANGSRRLFVNMIAVVIFIPVRGLLNSAASSGFLVIQVAICRVSPITILTISGKSLAKERLSK